MYLPSLLPNPICIFEDLETQFSNLEGLDSVSVGVGVFGPAAAYALVWELGSLRLKKPGKKTMWGINRDGAKRIFSTQAPGGYVGILSDSFWPIITNHLKDVDFSSSNIQLEFEVAMDNAAQEIANLIREWAPVDTGSLQSEIQSISSDEFSDLADAYAQGDTSFIIF